VHALNVYLSQAPSFPIYWLSESVFLSSSNVIMLYSLTNWDVFLKGLDVWEFHKVPTHDFPFATPLSLNEIISLSYHLSLFIQWIRQVSPILDTFIFKIDQIDLAISEGFEACKDYEDIFKLQMMTFMLH